MQETFAGILASLKRGLNNFRWYAKVIGERMRAEASLIGILKQVEDLKEHRDVAALGLAYRLFELRDEAGSTNVFEDPEVAERLSEIEELEEEMAELKEQAGIVVEVEE